MKTETRNYEIMQGVKSFARTALLAGSLTLGGCSDNYELPLDGGAKNMANNIVQLRQAITSQIQEHRAKKLKDFNDTEKKFFEPKIVEYQQKLKGLDALFTSCIKDGDFSISEQKQVADAFNNIQCDISSLKWTNFQNEHCGGMNSRYGYIENGAKGAHYLRCKDPRLDFPRRYDNVLSLCQENLYGLDAGKPNIQKALEAQKLPVNVQGKYSGWEKFWTGVGMIAGFLYLKSKLNEEEK